MLLNNMPLLPQILIDIFKYLLHRVFYYMRILQTKLFILQQPLLVLTQKSLKLLIACLHSKITLRFISSLNSHLILPGLPRQQRYSIGPLSNILTICLNLSTLRRLLSRYNTFCFLSLYLPHHLSFDSLMVGTGAVCSFTNFVAVIKRRDNTDFLMIIDGRKSILGELLITLVLIEFTEGIRF